MENDKVILAGKIAQEVREYIKPFIKKGVPLLEIAEKIESKMEELGGNPAFPTNLSINEIAAHFTPSYNDQTLASGLLKVDFGVNIEGNLSDTSFSVDLENSEENKKLIEASEKALENAINMLKKDIEVAKIGQTIQETIEKNKFTSIVNLSGHEINDYDLHAGLTIPNFDNKKLDTLTPGLYAIEPFVTSGVGKVHDGKPSGIYQLTDNKNIRSPIAREILQYIAEEYLTLPFCSRWLVKKFGTKALLGLNQLEQNGNVTQYNQLIEKSKEPVAQSEHTILVKEDGTIIVTTMD